MKKRLLLFLLIVPVALWSQVSFSTGSFDNALKLSSENGLLIFLQFDAADCSKCNEVADKAFEDKELSKLIQQSFICFRVGIDHPERKEIQDLYDIKSFGTYFIDQYKTLIHSFPKTTTYVKEYKDQIDKVLIKAGEDIRLNQLLKDYASNKNTDLLEMVLSKKRSLNLDTDPLLEEYVTMLSPDSAKSIRVLGFIAQLAPVIGSKADVLMRKDMTLFRTAWFRMSNNVRVVTNNKMIIKSRQKAIREKDEQYATRVASFASASHTDQYSAAATKAYEQNMLAYYKGVNDTLNYLIRSFYYYDHYYMTYSVDSIKRRDSINKEFAFASAKNELSKLPPPTSGTGTATTVTRRVSMPVRFAPVGQFIAREINEGAWNIYRMSSDPLHLQKAIQWTMKASSFWESPDILDTWSRLLYKSGKKSEAIAKEEEAIALQKKQGYSTQEFETVLAKMKKGTSILD